MEDTFRFKQFEIVQNQSVHRVGTDGVLLGAWVNIVGNEAILDIGTGTGLISLMLAQRSDGKASITALEPDADAFDLAIRNVNASKFSRAVKVINQRMQDFKGRKFDLIVCNPPFFINSLKPPTEDRTRQRHSVDLSFHELLTSAVSLLSPEGKLAVVLPTDEGNSFIGLAQTFGLHLTRQCAVYSKTGKPQERYLLELARLPVAQIEKSFLTIMDTKGEWTPEYKILTREFYLKF
jgi:tRNA1Val (adenine37-N6)-methyltransferase